MIIIKQNGWKIIELKNGKYELTYPNGKSDFFDKASEAIAVLRYNDDSESFPFPRRT